MSNLKTKWVLGGVLALVLVVGVVAVAGDTVKAEVGENLLVIRSVQEAKDLACAFGVQTACPVPVVEDEDEKVGAASPDFGEYISVNGLKFWASRSENPIQSTSTVCSLNSAPATSTLIMGSLRLDESATSSGVTQIEFGKSTGVASTTVEGVVFTATEATTTSLGTVLVSQEKGTIFASSTPQGGGAQTDPEQVFAPNSKLNIALGGSGGSGAGGGDATRDLYSITGVCAGLWLVN